MNQAWRLNIIDDTPYNNLQKIHEYQHFISYQKSTNKTIQVDL